MMTKRGGMKKNEEVLFEYGRHSPATLCAEYGFIEDIGEDGMGGRLGEVDSGWWVEELWQSLAEEEREWKEEILMNEGYLGFVWCGKAKLSTFLLIPVPVITRCTLIHHHRIHRTAYKLC
jgi:hypothetical protein